MEEITACPCTYLEEPCNPRCTCLHPYSSTGCLNCCSYGSLDQRKEMAKYLNKIRLESLKK